MCAGCGQLCPVQARPLPARLEQRKGDAVSEGGTPASTGGITAPVGPGLWLVPCGERVLCTSAVCPSGSQEPQD